MKLRYQLILFALTPLILALGAIAVTVYRQAMVLEQLQRGSIERFYKDSKDAELKNYSALAVQAIAHLYDTGRTDAEIMEEAKAILAALQYQPNGYFFLYDVRGVLLMHPRQPELVGRNLWDLRDADGKFVIQELVRRAQQGGGFEEFLWPKPFLQTGKPVPKRAYVLALKNWGWVLGTGMYTDDMEAVLAKLDVQAEKNIFGTMLWIVTIAFLSVISIVTGLMWSIRGRIVADAKVSALTQRIIKTQDDERYRIANALHDSIKPMLVSIKMKIEIGIHRLQGALQPPAVLVAPFKDATVFVDNTLGDLDRVIQGLRPFILEDLGLEGALRLLAHGLDNEHMRVEYCAVGDTKGLLSAGEEALLFVAQEAVANAVKYSSTKRIAIGLEGDSHGVMLTIHDDGHGFNIDHVQADPHRGLGLRNMKERLEAEGGLLRLTSSSSGTTVIARIPFH